MALLAPFAWVFAVSVLIALPTTSSAQQAPSLGGAELANPAAVACVDKLGGTIQIVDTKQGQAGYCHLKDGRVCEEWALFRDGACTAPP
jgi:putative hemolysin